MNQEIIDLIPEYNFKLLRQDKGNNVFPLKELRKLNNLDIVSLEYFKEKYNSKSNGPADMYTYFSFESLSNKLEKCCTSYNIEKKIIDIGVTKDYIKDRINIHYTSEIKEQDVIKAFNKIKIKNIEKLKNPNFKILEKGLNNLLKIYEKDDI